MKTEKLVVAGRVGMCGGEIVGKMTRKGHLKVFVQPSCCDDQEPRYTIEGVMSLAEGGPGHNYTTDAQYCLGEWIAWNKEKLDVTHLHGCWFLITGKMGITGKGLFRWFEKMIQRRNPNWTYDAD